MDMTNRKKVLVPVQKNGEKTFWFRIGTAFQNKDGSTNIYLDALPATTKLQVRDLDERDLANLARRDGDRDGGPGTSAVASNAGIPF